jgi:hypothetical protein
MKRFMPLYKLIAIEVFMLLFILAMHHIGIPLYCPFKLLTGIPCPGCGGQRALFAIMHGNIIEAVCINPLSVLLILFAFIAPMWLFVDCYRGTNSLQGVMKSKWSWKTITIVALVIIANWIWNIYKQL